MYMKIVIFLLTSWEMKGIEEFYNIKRLNRHLVVVERTN